MRPITHVGVETYEPVPIWIIDADAATAVIVITFVIWV